MWPMTNRETTTGFHQNILISWNVTRPQLFSRIIFIHIACQKQRFTGASPIIFHVCDYAHPPPKIPLTFSFFSNCSKNNSNATSYLKFSLILPITMPFLWHLVLHSDYLTFSFAHQSEPLINKNYMYPNLL